MNRYTDEEIILATLSGEVPPAWWWFYHSDPKSQESWDTVRRYFQKIYWRIKSFFSGVACPLKEIDPLDEEFYQLNANQYIDFYYLIWQNWSAVKSDLDILYKSTLWDGFKVESPGECLKNVIHEDCLCFYLERKEETDITNRTVYELFRLKGQVGNFKAKQNLTNLEKNKLKKLAKYQSRFRAFRMPHVLLDNCLATCENSKDKHIQKLLKRYKETCDDLNRVIQGRNHPNRKHQDTS